MPRRRYRTITILERLDIEMDDIEIYNPRGTQAGSFFRSDEDIARASRKARGHHRLILRVKFMETIRAMDNADDAWEASGTPQRRHAFAYAYFMGAGSCDEPTLETWRVFWADRRESPRLTGSGGVRWWGPDPQCDNEYCNDHQHNERT